MTCRPKTFPGSTLQDLLGCGAGFKGKSISVIDCMQVVGAPGEYRGHAGAALISIIQSGPIEHVWWPTWYTPGGSSFMMVKSLPDFCMACLTPQLSKDPSTSTCSPPWLPAVLDSNQSQGHHI